MEYTCLGNVPIVILEVHQSHCIFGKFRSAPSLAHHKQCNKQNPHFLESEGLWRQNEQLYSIRQILAQFWILLAADCSLLAHCLDFPCSSIVIGSESSWYLAACFLYQKVLISLTRKEIRQFHLNLFLKCHQQTTKDCLSCCHLRWTASTDLVSVRA